MLIPFSAKTLLISLITRDVFVDVQQTVLARVSRQGHFREVDRRYGRAVVAVLDQFFCHFQADVGLGFSGGTTDVRGQDHVVQATQRAFEHVVVGTRLTLASSFGGV